MSPSSPVPGAGTGPPDVEDLLRARLHEVDELTPPDTGFEQRALRAGRERAGRRRSWTRGLVGVAAAAVIGAVVVPTVLRHDVGGGSAGSSAVAEAPAQSLAQDQGVPGPAPQGPENQQGDGGSSGGGTARVPDGDVTLALPVGQTPFDWESSDGQTRLSDLRAALTTPRYAASQTTLRVDGSVVPSRLVVRMGTSTPAVVSLVTSAFPAGAPIVFTIAQP